MKMWLRVGQEMPIPGETLWLKSCGVLTVIYILGERGLCGGKREEPVSWVVRVKGNDKVHRSQHMKYLCLAGS